MDQPHKRNERVTVRWPNGLYDFVVEFGYVEEVNAPGWEGWVSLHGIVVEPEGPQHHAWRGFYCHRIGDREYEMLPHRKP